MKHIYLNLKRFDISPALGGVNRLAPMADWGKTIVEAVQEGLSAYPDTEFAVFFPEAHLLSATAARKAGSPVRIGCQGVYRADTAVGGNFGAFTANRTANAMKEAGCGLLQTEVYQLIQLMFKLLHHLVCKYQLMHLIGKH